ncbi:MAG: DUF2339 domain-containing protein [Methanoregulaceae archaeon]|nr:DUF2339 domain-containing protein [Methanoregulaceae archaeon]
MDPEALRSILERLDQIEQRLNRLEGRTAIPRPATPPPPPPPTTPVAPPVQVEFDLGPVTQQPVKPTKPSGLDELQLGGRVLPIVGGAVFLLSIVFLIALGISRGMLTPQVQFFGALGLSTTFVILGALKRDEREGFGQVLSAVGSGGLYLTAAGGHVYHGLYESSVVVIAFVMLGLANLAYSLGRGSLPFYGLGVAGGLVGAVLPMSEKHTELHAGLHLLILLTAGAIAVRRQWFVPYAATWMIGGMIVLPWLGQDPMAPNVRLALVGAHALISSVVLAWSTRFERHSGEPPFSIAALALAAGGLAMMLVPAEANLHLGPLVLALAAGAAAFLMPKSLARERLAAAAVTTGSMLAPWGDHQPTTTFIFAGLAAVYAAIAYRREIGTLSLLSAVLIIEGVFAMQVALHGWRDDFFVRAIGETGRPLAMQLSGSLAVAAFLACAAFVRTQGKTAGSLTLALTTPLIGYLAYVTFFPWDTSGAFGIPIGIGVMVAVFAAYLSQTREPTAVLLGWIGTAVAVGLFWYGVLQVGEPVLLVPALLVSLATMGAMTLATIQRGTGEAPDIARFLFGLLGGSLIARFLYEGILWQFVVARAPAGTVALTLWLAGLMIWAGARPSWAMVPLVSIYAFVVGLAHVGAFAFGTTPLEISLLVAYLPLIAAFGSVMVKNGIERTTAYTIASAIGWIPFSTLGVRLLADQSGMMSQNGATTVSWTVYGALILAIGFALKSSGPRLFALGLFGLTVAKVLIVDLAALDPVIRIAALMLLGAVMIGAGYAYVRLLRRPEEKLIDPDEASTP